MAEATLRRGKGPSLGVRGASLYAKVASWLNAVGCGLLVTGFQWCFKVRHLLIMESTDIAKTD